MAARQRKSSVFGSSLSSSSDSTCVPDIVFRLIDYFDNKGSGVEGLFRVSARIDDVEKLKKTYDRKKEINLQAENMHVNANLLKLYFRELPDPLFTFDAYDRFISVAKLFSEPEKIGKVKMILATLPMINRVVIKYLFKFLYRVSVQSSINKMTANNLAIVFAPTVLRPKDPLQLIGGSSDSQSVVELMISESDRIFEHEPDYTPQNAALKTSWSKSKDSNLAQALEKELMLMKSETQAEHGDAVWVPTIPAHRVGRQLAQSVNLSEMMQFKDKTPPRPPRPGALAAPPRRFSSAADIAQVREQINESKVHTRAAAHSSPVALSADSGSRTDPEEEPLPTPMIRPSRLLPNGRPVPPPRVRSTMY